MAEENRPQDGGENSTDYQKEIAARDEALKAKDEELKKLREFGEQSSLIIQHIGGNKELRENLRKSMREAGLVAGGEEPGEQQEEGTKAKDDDGDKNPELKNVTERLGGVEASQRERVINEFENSTGIAQLEDDKRKEIRRQIEAELNVFGYSVKTAPLATLNRMLERSFTAVRADQLKEEGKIEGFTMARKNDMATFGSFSGSRLNNEGEEKKSFTSSQLAWMKKMGVDPEKAKKTAEEKENERTRVPGGEKKH